MTGYPTHRCGECTLMRCHGPGETCDECRAHARDAFNRVSFSLQLPDGKKLDLGEGYAAHTPFDWHNYGMP